MIGQALRDLAGLLMDGLAWVMEHPWDAVGWFTAWMAASVALGVVAGPAIRLGQADGNRTPGREAVR